jgi:hypothetical protein
VTDELERAIRSETQTALLYWFGLSWPTIRGWGMRGLREELNRRAKRLGVSAHRNWILGGWTPEQLALLGTMPDEMIANRVGRRVESVAAKRVKLRIPPFDQVERRGRPKKEPPH